MKYVMFNPPHPGEVVKELCLEPSGLSITKAARILKVSRKTLSEVVNCKSAISPEMAIRLEMAFGSTAEHWLRMQAQHDLWHAKEKLKKLKIEKIAA